MTNMTITFFPQRRDEILTLAKLGEVLLVNGEELDLSFIPEGATLPAEAVESDWICGPIERIDGVLHLNLVLPHGANAPHQARFPVPLALTEDGPVTLPARDLETSDAD